jgi:hypothetical protein
MMAGVLPVPCREVVLPPPVHILNAPKHARPTSCFIYLHQSLHILLTESSKILWTENPDQNLGKDAHNRQCFLFFLKKIEPGILMTFLKMVHA